VVTPALRHQLAGSRGQLRGAESGTELILKIVVRPY
jgi:hypothetical protein